MSAQPDRDLPARFGLRAIAAGDEAFLRRVYAGTRLDELAPLGWSAEQVDGFIAMQFEAQRRDYWRNYDTSRFHVVTCDGVDAGRLYVERRADELRVVDIALLPEFRRRGIATYLFGVLFEEADAAGIAVRIHVEHNNPAQHLYLRLGFAFCGETGPIYRLMERLPRAGHAGCDA
ncbi:MAG: GNAT family N-acetyltransferase [Rhodanobacteraceae bacterium]|jgi:ribosomal protein S18 acetylase RimI-like enzyme|nr:GNAT family N-acetyltransferase [Rhodanobacteraceae bacterium]